MKALLLTAALLAAGTTVLEKKPYSINDPTWNDRFLVIQEFEAGDDLPWDIEMGNHLDVLKTDAGEIFRPDVMFTPSVVLPGDKDPRKPGYEKLEEGTHLLVWELSKPKTKWKSIQRLAGHYELTHGGETRWVDVPLMLEQGADPIDWEDETLEEAGFKLKARIEGLRMLQVQITKRPWEFDEAVLLDEDDKEFAYQGSSTTGDVWTQSFEIGDREQPLPTPSRSCRQSSAVAQLITDGHSSWCGPTLGKTRDRTWLKSTNRRQPASESLRQRWQPFPQRNQTVFIQQDLGL